MPPTLAAYGLDKLSLADRMVLRDALDDSIQAEVEDATPTPELLAEIDRRIAAMDADPGRGVPWEVVRDAARARSRARWSQ